MSILKAIITIEYDNGVKLYTVPFVRINNDNYFSKLKEVIVNIFPEQQIHLRYINFISDCY